MTGQLLSIIGILQCSVYLLCKEVQAVQPKGSLCIGPAPLHVHDVRFEGCVEEPCKIRKGESLPFELDMSFERADESADTVNLQVFNNYYAIPPSVYLDRISHTSCSNDTLGVDCPISPNVRYTLKSSMFIDKRAVCTAGCDNLGPDGTGLRDTSCVFSIYNTHEMKQDAECRFQIALDITSA